MDIADLASKINPPAPSVVFGTHLSATAAAAMRLSVSAEENTPETVKLLDLLKSCQSLYTEDDDNDNDNDNDNDCNNNEYEVEVDENDPNSAHNVQTTSQVASKNIITKSKNSDPISVKKQNLASPAASGSLQKRTPGLTSPTPTQAVNKTSGNKSVVPGSKVVAVTPLRGKSPPKGVGSPVPVSVAQSKSVSVSRPISNTQTRTTTPTPTRPVSATASRTPSRTVTANTSALTTAAVSRDRSRATSLILSAAEIEREVSDSHRVITASVSRSSRKSSLLSGVTCESGIGSGTGSVVMNNVSSSSKTYLKNNISLSASDVRTPSGKILNSSLKTPLNGTNTILRTGIPETKPHERILQMERVLSYCGGPSLLLNEGKLLVIASSSLIVLIDTHGSAVNADINNPGLWRVFKSFTTGTLNNTDEKDNNNNFEGRIPSEVMGCEQAFLKGHNASIGLLELSPNGVLMASAECCARGAVLIWNVLEGKRIATLRPHTDSVTAVSFNHDCTLLVTAGTDVHRRAQIMVWDIQTLISQGAPLSIVARQISEFPISKIRFSPFEESSLVACGRENVRFFRIRKGHLPACPVQLNEFSRGFIFTDFVFNSEPGRLPLDPRRPCAFFSSNRGILLKVDCLKKQVMCGYQLHSGPIQSLAIHEGYAVTGGGDNRLRIWPLDFSDFLLEAQHEAAVTSISVSQDGRKLSVGTSAGTLGVLDVSEHR